MLEAFQKHGFGLTHLLLAIPQQLDIEIHRPVFARGTSLLTTKLHGRGDSQINQSIHSARVTVSPGDLVLADDNGVLFLDWRTVAAVIDQALASGRAEPRLLERLRAGEPVAQVLSVDALYGVARMIQAIEGLATDFAQTCVRAPMCCSMLC